MDDETRQYADSTWKDQADRVDALSRPTEERGVSIHAHPMWVVLLLLVGIGALVNAVVHMDSPRELLVAVAAGIVYGLPMVLMWKRFLRRNRGYYAKYYTTPYVERNSWKNSKRHLLCLVLVMLGFAVSFGVDGCLHLPWYSTYSVLCILGIMVYPEQKAIWLAAKARVAQIDREQAHGQ